MTPEGPVIFRRAAVEYQRKRLAGQVVITPTRRMTALLAAYFGVLALAGVAAASMQLSVSAPAQRTLVPAQGALAVGAEPPRAGAVPAQLQVRPLDLIISRLRTTVAPQGSPRTRRKAE